MQRDEEKAWLLNKERHNLLVKSNETKKIRVSWEDFNIRPSDFKLRILCICEKQPSEEKPVG